MMVWQSYANVVRALTRREGLRLAAAGPLHLERKRATSPLVAELAPLRVLLEPVNAEIVRADEPASDRGGHRTHDLRIRRRALHPPGKVVTYLPAASSAEPQDG